MTCRALFICVAVLYLLLQLANGLVVNPRWKDNQRSLLYPFEYDSHSDWELVPYDDASVEVVTWIMGLTDRLTVSRQLPLGQDLMVWFCRDIDCLSGSSPVASGKRSLPDTDSEPVVGPKVQRERYRGVR